MKTVSPTCAESLADLFIALGSSLLQYFDEADPWTDRQHAASMATFDRLAESQRKSYRDIADIIARKHIRLESVSYPSEFASLHYLALDFVLGKVIANQIGVVAACDAAMQSCQRDPSARILQQVRAREANHLVELRRLTDSFYDESKV